MKSNFLMLVFIILFMIIINVVGFHDAIPQEVLNALNPSSTVVQLQDNEKFVNFISGSYANINIIKIDII